jgi:hypothetical protein
MGDHDEERYQENDEEAWCAPTCPAGIAEAGRRTTADDLGG